MTKYLTTLAIVLLMACGGIDRGNCLRLRVEHHHEDAGFESVCLPTMGFDGQLAIDCSPHWTPARDWAVTVCDEWEFPNGKAERSE